MYTFPFGSYLVTTYKILGLVYVLIDTVYKVYICIGAFFGNSIETNENSLTHVNILVRRMYYTGGP